MSGETLHRYERARAQFWYVDTKHLVAFRMLARAGHLMHQGDHPFTVTVEDFRGDRA